MNITVTCDGCGQKLSVPANLAGRRVPCPKCNAPIDVPGSAHPVPSLAAPQVAPEQPSAIPITVDVRVNDLGHSAPSAPYPVARPAVRSKGRMVPVIAILAVLLLAGGGIGAWLMLAKAGGGDLRYLPDDLDVVLSADVNGIISSGVGQKIKAQASDMLNAIKNNIPKDAKFKPEDIGRITVGMRVKTQEVAGIVHFNRAVTDQEFPNADKVEKKTVGQYQMSVNGKQAIYRIDDRTIAVGEETSLRKILERNGAPKLSDELTAAMNEVDFSKPLAAAASVNNLANLAGATGAGAMNPGMMPGGADGIRSIALQADIGGEVRLKAVTVCKDATIADQTKKMADGGIALLKTSAGQMPPVVTKILNSVEISISGSTVRATATIDMDAVNALIEMAAKGGMAPAGPDSNPLPGPTP